LGTFYPPNGVFLTTNVLETLPPDERRSGWGEIWKLHFIGGEERLTWLQTQNADCGVGREDRLWPCIESALRIKKEFIETDEFDRGARNLLNFGHTFAHAFEAATHYAIPHGIAVSLGIDAALELAVQRGFWQLETRRAQELRSWLRDSHTPFGRLLSEVSVEDIIDAMRRDKKNQGDMITFILPRAPGLLEKHALPANTALTNFLLHWREKIA
jgi:3-dehydroquinate synthase